MIPMKRGVFIFSESAREQTTRSILRINHRDIFRNQLQQTFMREFQVRKKSSLLQQR